MKIFVTGATGFVGHTLIKKLKSKKHILKKWKDKFARIQNVQKQQLCSAQLA